MVLGSKHSKSTPNGTPIDERTSVNKKKKSEKIRDASVESGYSNPDMQDDHLVLSTENIHQLAEDSIVDEGDTLSTKHTPHGVVVLKTSRNQLDQSPETNTFPATLT